MRNIYVIPEESGPYRHPFRFSLAGRLGTQLVFTKDELKDNSVLIIHRAFFSNPLYITVEQLEPLKNFSDFHILIYEDFSTPVNDLAERIIRLIQTCQLNSKCVWVQLPYSSELTKLKIKLEEHNIYGVNYVMINTYVRNTITKYDINVIDSIKQEVIPKKKFTVFSRRYDSSRLHFFSGLIANNLIDDFLYSFTHLKPEQLPPPHEFQTKDSLKEHPLIDHYYSESKEKIHNWINDLPYIIGTFDNLTDPYNLEVLKAFRKGSIHVSIETSIGYNSNVATECIMVTEKTYKALLMEVPFLILSHPNTLMLLKNEGFLTFDSIFDENYDSMEENVDRINSIINTISKINRMSHEDLTKKIQDVQNITKHNYNHLMNIFQRSVKNEQDLITKLNLVTNNSK